MFPEHIIPAPEVLDDEVELHSHKHVFGFISQFNGHSIETQPEVVDDEVELVLEVVEVELHSHKHVFGFTSQFNGHSIGPQPEVVYDVLLGQEQIQGRRGHFVPGGQYGQSN